MKRILIAALLVLIMSVGSFAAAVTISGEMKYGFTKTGDDDAAWYGDPAFKLKFSNENFELRLVGATTVNKATLTCTECGQTVTRVIDDWDWDECYSEEDAWILTMDEYEDFYQDHDCSLSTESSFGVKVDRANVKLPVKDVGTFVFGRAFFGTGDWDAMGATHDGISWSNTFDKLSLKALWDVKNEKLGARAAVALGKVAVGANYFQELEDEEEDAKSYSVDARFDLNENFDFYGEFGDDDGEDIRALAAEARVGGFDLYLGRDLAAEETEVYAEKTYNSVLFHAGYVKADADEDGEVEVYAKYTF